MTDQTPADEIKSSGKPLMIVGAAAALVIALAGAGAYAYTKLSGGGSQPHDVLPASVVAYARIDADPSAGQKIAILRLIRKFPELAKQIGIKDVDQDIRKLLVEDAVKGCGLDYDKDVEPWLGNRVGVAYDSATESPVVAVQVSDEAKARTGINKLADCGGTDSETGIAFLNGYALVTPKKADAAKVSAAATKSPLAEKAAYVDDADELGEQGVFSAWADLKAISELDDVKNLSDDFSTSFTGVGTAAFTLRAGSSSLEVSSITHLDKAPGVVKSTNLADLPEGTALALSISGFGDQVAGQLDSGFLGELDGADGEELGTLEDTFGLKLPEDLETLLGDGFMLAVGSRNLESLPMMAGPQDISQLDIGLKLITDPTKGADLAKRLVDLAAELDIKLAATPTADGVVIATNKAAADAFAGGGKLGDSDNFKEAVAHTGAYPALFIDLDSILEALAASNPPPDVADVLDELEPLSAFAVSSTFDDKLLKATLRLTLD